MARTRADTNKPDIPQIQYDKKDQTSVTTKTTLPHSPLRLTQQQQQLAGRPTVRQNN